MHPLPGPVDSRENHTISRRFLFSVTWIRSKKTEQFVGFVDMYTPGPENFLSLSRLLGLERRRPRRLSPLAH
eukprot:scaffold316588_cov21-Tisochrysis_lutea.AAC.1